MMVTEAEAAKMICPYGRMRTAFDGNWDQGQCAASRCMAWRWDAEHVEQPKDGFDDKMVCVRGHCGLAGSPSGRPQP